MSCGCATDGCSHAAPRLVQDWVDEQQRRLGRIATSGRTWWRPQSRPDLHRRELRRCARWWDLEAMRRYPSSDWSREYAANQRWIVELLDNGVDINQSFHVLLKEHGKRADP